MKEPLELFRAFVELDRRRASGLDPFELRRWLDLKRRLARHFHPELSDREADRRASIRVPVQMRVTFRDVGELKRCWMTNLSRGGLFVATEHPAPIGTELTLRLTIAEGGDEIELPVAVVSHDLDPSFQRRRGMGLRFRELRPDLEKKLGDLYEAALHRATARRP